MTSEAVFVRDGDRFLATDLALGPWAPGALHGGAPAALLAHAFQAAAPSPQLRPARITFEFVRPVPPGPLGVGIEVVRPGRRVTLLDGSLTDPDGVEVARARALLMVASEIDAMEPDRLPFAGPEAGELNDWHEERPMFATHAMEIRFVEGAFGSPGRPRPGFACGTRWSPASRCSAASSGWPPPPTSATGSRRCSAGTSTCSSTPT